MKSLFIALLASTIMFNLGCKSIDLPKGTSEGFSSFRFIKVDLNPDYDFVEESDDIDSVIQSCITQKLGANSIARDDDNADLIVGYLLLRQDNVTTARIDTYFGYGKAGNDIANIAHKRGVVKGKNRDQFEKGAIVIDVIDTQKNQLVYRSYAVRDIDGIPDVQMPLLVESAVEEALQPFFQ